MMLERYRTSVNSVPDDVAELLLTHLGVPTRDDTISLFDFLREWHVGQCDVVLALLRLNSPRCLRCASAVMGRRITKCPPSLAQVRGPRPPAPRVPSGDDRRVTWRMRQYKKLNGRKILPGTPIYFRLEKIRVGLSVRQLLARGLRRKDLRIASRRKWIRLEGT
jgi:hypothetical protein